MLHYNLADFNSVDQFLAQLARRIGKLRRGARPDMNAAAKRVLNDWNVGKLRYYTHPPENSSATNLVQVPAEVVAQFSKEFDIDAISDEQNEIVEGLPMESDVVVPHNSDEEDDEAEEMETDSKQQQQQQTVTSGKKLKKATVDDEKPVMPESLALEGNVQLNKLIKNAIKKQKKKSKKTANRADKLSDSLGNMLGDAMEM
uniref:Uncharacterized protein n=1 Tax=Caenorhabditis japonica TaxID=281687 RepID=A0A8R1IZI5_CAEJA